MRPARVAFSPAAEADLFALYEYIAQAAGVVRAGAYIDRIESACMALAMFPERGTSRHDVSPGLRTLGFERRATIMFRVELSTVVIVGIFYGGRDFEGVVGVP